MKNCTQTYFKFFHSDEKFHVWNIKEANKTFLYLVFISICYIGEGMSTLNVLPGEWRIQYGMAKTLGWIIITFRANKCPIKSPLSQFNIGCKLFWVSNKNWVSGKQIDALSGTWNWLDCSDGSSFCCHGDKLCQTNKVVMVGLRRCCINLRYS